MQALSRLSIKPLALMVGVYCLIAAIAILDSYHITLSQMVVLILLPISMLIYAMWQLRKRRFYSAVSIFMAITVVLGPLFLIRPNPQKDLWPIRYALFKHHYLECIQRAGSLLAICDTYHDFSGTPREDIGFIVYDKSDELTLLHDQQSMEWKNIANKQNGTFSDVEYYQVLINDHFYRVRSYPDYSN